MATILIVDDRATNREVLVTLLGYQGHRLLEAADGAEALALAQVERPDLIMTDIIMPTMDGYEFVQRLRSEPTLAQTPLIFYSAYYQAEETQALANATGVPHILVKPSDPEVVLQAVEAALNMRSSTSLPSSEGTDRDYLRLLTHKFAQKVEELEREIAERKQAETALLRSIEQMEIAYQQSVIYARELKTEVVERKRAEAAAQQAQEQLRNLASYLQTAREKERTLIAREIHDEFGQALTALKMDLAWVIKRLPPSELALLQKTRSMSHLIDDTIRVVQRIATDLRPGILDNLGLGAAIEWQTREFAKRTGLECHLQLDNEALVLDRDLSTTLFRVFQETLTNIARHAKATQVWIRLENESNNLVLTVRDNGIGITKHQVNGPQSLGLIGMQERVHSWGGRITFQSKPGQGTTVRVSIPRPKEA